MLFGRNETVMNVREIKLGVQQVGALLSVVRSATKFIPKDLMVF